MTLAPPPGDRGFLLGAQYLTNSIGSTEPEAEPDQLLFDEIGRGLEIVVGYSFTPHVDLRLTLGSALHGTSLPTVDLAYSTVAFALHYRFRPGAQVRPNVLGGLGGTTVELEDPVEETGSAGKLMLGLVWDF